MNTHAHYLAGLVRELVKLPREVEWVEFKQNNDDPQQLGEYISALANAAALAGKTKAYLLWGVRDDDHDIVGTNVDPKSRKKGNEELESWLLRLLKPRIDFCFDEVLVDEKRVVVLEIDRAARHPVAFDGVEYLRVGSYKKKLKDFPEKERALWRLFERMPFEEGMAAEHLTDSDVLAALDSPSFFALVQAPLPDGRSAILDSLRRERLLATDGAGGWRVTNLGAILFARRLGDFPSLQRKALRVIQYRDRDRTETLREHVGEKGYANGFEALMSFINGLLPTSEVVGQALRRETPAFPPLAVRELVANALIHQDFSAAGTGPMVEIFEGRVEITNPGEPLVETDRFLDSPPTSRNEGLASLMRRLGICEERGSGIDKVVAQIEYHQLPAPLFEVPPGFTRVVLFAPRPLADMDKADRVRACYLHACLKYVQRDYLTNTSVRERFGIEEHNRAVASRLIRDTLAAGLIAAHDPNASPRYKKYVPVWATHGSEYASLAT